jgi:hypothetical protein
MAIKYIHVNQHKIRSNKKNNENEPVLTVKEGKTNTYGHSVEIHGPSEIIYGGNDKPILPCGARVVIETHAPIEILKPNDYVQANLKNANKQ